MDPVAEQLIARLRRNPADVEAFSALRAHYHRRGDYASLANLLQGWAAQSQDGQTASVAFQQAAELVQTHLADTPRAISLFERARHCDPANVQAERGLEDVVRGLNDLNRLLPILQHRAVTLRDNGAAGEQIAPIHVELGDLFLRRPGQEDAALAHYRSAIELEPRNLDALRAARRLLQSRGNHQECATLYQLEADTEADPIRRQGIFRELAAMLRDEMGNPEAAVNALRHALHSSPANLETQYELATTLLLSEESGTDSFPAARQEAADLLCRLAHSVPTGHAIAYAQAALDALPTHEDALSLLEQLAEEAGEGDLLPVRWVQYLQGMPTSEYADHVRRSLGHAYLSAGQPEDAEQCFRPLLLAGDAEAARILIELYRDSGRAADMRQALALSYDRLPQTDRIPKMQELVDICIAEGQREEAAEYCRAIIALDPTNGNALGYLLDRAREADDFEQLRDLLLAAARAPGVEVHERKRHLREVASISESSLSDLLAATDAWKAVCGLDPGDLDARRALQRLLELRQQWDELVRVLDRDALTATDPKEKAGILRKVARIHRIHRHDSKAAISCYKALLDIHPSDDEAGRELCEALLSSGHYDEAVPLLRARIAGARGEDRVLLLHSLASVLHDHIGDGVGAFEACESVLETDSSDVSALDRMERIDLEAQQWDRLFDTLSRHANIVSGEERVQVLLTAARVARDALQDPDRATRHLTEALDEGLFTQELMEELHQSFMAAGRPDGLARVLRKQIPRAPDADTRLEVMRRLARLLSIDGGVQDAAREAWTALLEEREDSEALQFLSAHARQTQDPASLDGLLGRLTNLCTDALERQRLVLERCELLANELDNVDGAKVLLDELLPNLGSLDRVLLDRIAELARRVRHPLVLSSTLTAQLTHAASNEERVRIARELSGVQLDVLRDQPSAVDTLVVWATSDPSNPEPHRLLLGPLEDLARWEELVSSLDWLVELEEETQQVSAHALRAAEITASRLRDVDGAWRRLVGRVKGGDIGAEDALIRLASAESLGEDLAELYIEMARESDELAVQMMRWHDASRAFEDLLADPIRALEASLRALALDLSDEAALSEVERLSIESAAWERLGRVYDRLVESQVTEEGRVRYLLRHAEFLELRAAQPAPALDRLLEACRIAFDDEALLARTEELAHRVEGEELLLQLYEQRFSEDTDRHRGISTLMRAVTTCIENLDDPIRAKSYLESLIQMAAPDIALLEQLENDARELSRDLGGRGESSPMRLLVEAYEQRARESADADPSLAAALLLRAAHILAEDLDGLEAALAIAQDAVTLAPANMQVLDELERLGEKAGRLDETQLHLDQLIRRSLNQATALELIRRRAGILRDKLRRFSEAADTYGQLLAVRPQDHEVLEAQRECLRKAGRHQDTLMLLERQLPRVAAAARPPMLREMAHTWELVDNSWEAIDSWRKVLALVPNDAEALEGIDRLSAGTREIEPELEERQPSTKELALPEGTTPLGTVDAHFEDAPTDPGNEGDTAPESGDQQGMDADTLDTDLKRLGIGYRISEQPTHTEGTAEVSFEEVMAEEGTTEEGMAEEGMAERGGTPKAAIRNELDLPVPEPGNTRPGPEATFEIDLRDMELVGPGSPGDNATNEIDLEDVLVSEVETSAHTEMIDLEEVLVSDDDSE